MRRNRPARITPSPAPGDRQTPSRCPPSMSGSPTRAGAGPSPHTSCRWNDPIPARVPCTVWCGRWPSPAARGDVAACPGYHPRNAGVRYGRWRPWGAGRQRAVMDAFTAGLGAPGPAAVGARLRDCGAEPYGRRLMAAQIAQHGRVCARHPTADGATAPAQQRRAGDFLAFLFGQLRICSLHGRGSFRGLFAATTFRCTRPLSGVHLLCARGGLEKSDWWQERCAIKRGV